MDVRKTSPPVLPLGVYPIFLSLKFLKSGETTTAQDRKRWSCNQGRLSWTEQKVFRFITTLLSVFFWSWKVELVQNTGDTLTSVRDLNPSGLIRGFLTKCHISCSELERRLITPLPVLEGFIVNRVNKMRKNCSYTIRRKDGFLDWRVRFRYLICPSRRHVSSLGLVMYRK